MPRRSIQDGQLKMTSRTKPPSNRSKALESATANIAHTRTILSMGRHGEGTGLVTASPVGRTGYYLVKMAYGAITHHIRV